MVLGWFAWCFSSYMAISNFIGCRMYVNSGRSFTWATAIQTLFWWVIAIVFLFASINKLHILWLIPVSFFSAQFLSLSNIPIISPFVLFVTKLFMNLVLIGCKKEANRMFLKPKWLKILPRPIWPTDKSIKKLEALRKELNAPHDLFSFAILGAPQITKKVQCNCLAVLIQQNPDQSKKTILNLLFQQRMESIQMNNLLDKYDLSDFNKHQSGFCSLKELCDFFIEQETLDYVPFGGGKEIYDILDSEEKEKNDPYFEVFRDLNNEEEYPSNLKCGSWDELRLIKAVTIDRFDYSPSELSEMLGVLRIKINQLNKENT